MGCGGAVGDHFAVSVAVNLSVNVAAPVGERGARYPAVLCRRVIFGSRSR